jgi:type VI secretion system FHA domain protein
MMILRLVQRPDGTPPGPAGRPLEPAGSTIGRAPDCDLVLDDPLRMVSRRHAWIVPQADDQALLRCTSTTSSLLVNDEILAPGAERAVRIGDRLSIGGFEVLLEGDEFATVTLPVPTDTVAIQAPAPAPLRIEPLAAEAAPPSREPRLDQWFKLDSIADPLGPGSPLPALDPAARAAAPRSGTSAPGLAGASAPESFPWPSHPLPSGVPTPPPVEAASILQQPLAAPDRRQRPPEAAAWAAPSGRVDAALPLDDEVNALRRAFLRGAGLDDGAPLVLDPARMAQFGAMLRVAVEGMLELLQSGAGIEPAVTTEGTHFVVRKNNPLSFAPDATEALRLLLNTAGWSGFLDPVAALRDAHHDLWAQRQAQVDALRVAVVDLVANFGPGAIEAADGPAQGLGRLFPLLRDAAHWRQQAQHHALLLDRLDALFGAALEQRFRRGHESPSAPDSVSRLRPAEVHAKPPSWPGLDIET